MCGEWLVEDQLGVYRLEGLELLGTLVVGRHGVEQVVQGCGRVVCVSYRDVVLLLLWHAIKSGGCGDWWVVGVV